jgi:xylulokinase
MNLLDLKSFQWDREIAEFTAPGLPDKLPPCVPSVQVCGKLSGYFAKYGLKSGIPVTVWSGDNPNSLIGCGGTDSRTAVISLGTSDTFFGTRRSFDEAPKKSGHVFGHPAGGFMSLICFTNGSLTREHFRKKYGLTYSEFDAQAAAAAPGKFQMLPFLFPESTPAVSKPGIIRNFDPAKVSAGETIRALLESQMLTMYHHAELKRRPEQIRLTGGASASSLLRQLAADIFQAPVLIGESAESAALGAAMRAANSIAGTDFETLTAKFCRIEQRIEPDPALAEIYQKALRAFAELLGS